MNRGAREDRDGSDGLGALLEAEERLAALDAEREKEAAGIVAAAELEARERLAALEAELERQAQGLAASIEAGGDRLARRLVQEARATAERYRSVPEEKIAELAAFVVAEVIGTVAEGTK
jgi:vacuolar-type H+-ATPase subunit H